MGNKDLKIVNIDFENVSCKKQDKESKKIPIARIIEKLDFCFSKNDLSSAEDLLEYWQSVAIRKEDLSGELSIVNEMLGLYRKIPNKQKGEKAIFRASELLELNNMNNSVSGGTIMLNIATACNAFGYFEKAVSFYERASEIYKTKLKKDDLKLAALYNNYATTLVDLGHFEKAKGLYNEAIKLTNKNISTLLDEAITYVNMAHLYEKSEGELSQNIEKCLKNAQDILENEEIERNSYYAFVCEKCASSFDYFGFFQFANKLNKISREIYERA